MSSPVMHVSVERKFNLGNFQHEIVTVGISQVPIVATDALIAQMLQTSDRVVTAIRSEIETRLNPRNPAAFHDAEPGTAKFGNEEAVSTVKFTEDSEASEVPVASGQPQSWDTPAPEPNRIPDESEVTTNKAHVFGVDVHLPPAELLLQPIEATDASGGQGKQMKYLNTALTSAGFVDSDRHWASLAIIKAAFGGIARASLTSLKELTKGEAHVIADWLMSAGDHEISQLKSATSALKGQLVIGEQYCDEHPFCEHNWQGKGTCVEEAVLV